MKSILKNSINNKKTALSGKIAMSIFAAVALLIPLTACDDDLPPNYVHYPEDIQDRYIGVLQGSPSLRLASDYGTVRVAFSEEDLMTALRGGDVDAVLMESTAASAVVSRTSGVRTLDDPLIEYELRFAVPVENPEFLRVINSALDTLESNGVLQGLRDKYFGASNFTYSPPDDVTQRPGRLVLAVSPDAYPFSFRDQYGELTGLHVDVAIAISDLRGLELQTIAVEPGELVTAVWHGFADFSAGWLPDDIGYFISVSEPYAVISHSVIVRR